jgi:hypothetical protein
MKAIDILVLVSLALFYALFLGRTVLLYKKGVKVWVIGSSGKKTIEKILENILFPVLLAWSVLLIVTALKIKLPAFISNYVVNIFWLKYTGAAFC